MPDGGTEIQIPVPIVTLDLPVPNYQAVVNAGNKMASGILNFIFGFCHFKV